MITVSYLKHSCGGCSPPSPLGSFAYNCSCFLTFVGYSQASFILATLLQVSRKFRGFVLQCQHVSFPDPSYNFRGFPHDFSPGQSSSCHSFILHCQHGSSLKLLDNPPSFCQLSSDCFPRSTTLEYYTRSLST